MQQVCDSSANASVLIDLTEAVFIDCQIIGWLVRWCEHSRGSTTFRLCVATGVRRQATDRPAEPRRDRAMPGQPE